MGAGLGTFLGMRESQNFAGGFHLFWELRASTVRIGAAFAPLGVVEANGEASFSKRTLGPGC